MYHALGIVSDEQYNTFFKKIKNHKNYIECFYALYTSSKEAMKRYYLSSLALTGIRSEDIERYNSAFLRTLPKISQNCDTIKLIDTTNSDKMDASVQVAEGVLNRIRKMY